jgi:uncharacterized protein (TIGR00369 family)
MNSERATTKLEALQQMITGEREFPPSGKTLGLKMVEVDEGTTTIEMDVKEPFLNRGGGVQGGFLAALVDAAMGTSLGTICAIDENHATLEFKLNFLRPASARNTPLRATGKVLFRGRNFAHTEGDIVGSDGKLVAKATASWIIRRNEAEGDRD